MSISGHKPSNSQKNHIQNQGSYILATWGNSLGSASQFQLWTLVVLTWFPLLELFIICPKDLHIKNLFGLNACIFDLHFLKYTACLISLLDINHYPHPYYEDNN